MARHVDDDTALGRHISYLLRHHPEAAGLSMDGHGWVYVDDLIEGVNAHSPFSIDQTRLERIVAGDVKQRYAYSDDGLRIRANQGHSIDVDVEPVRAVPPDVLWHGTAVSSVPSINEEGLLPMGRLFVHLSVSPEAAREVGARHGRPFVYCVDAASMASDGIEFFLSANRIWLVKAVPSEYLSYV